MNQERILRRITPAGLLAMAGVTQGGAQEGAPASYAQARTRTGPAPCPWVGVPVPGRPALVIERARLRAVLQGIELDRVEVVEPRNPPASPLRLRIHGHAPYRGARPVICRYVLLDLRWVAGKWKLGNVGWTIREWKERAQERRTQAQARAQQTPEQRSQDYKQRRVDAARNRLLDGIAKVERQIGKHKTRGAGSYRPRPLFMASAKARSRYPVTNGDADTQYQQELEWRAERARRRTLGTAVALVRDRYKTNQQRYAGLAELGFPLLKWGDRTANHWESYYGFSCVDDYWKYAYRVQGSGCVAKKPHRDTGWVWTLGTDKNRKYPSALQEAQALKERVEQHRKDMQEHAGWWRELKSLESIRDALERELWAFDRGQENNGECPACGTGLERMPGAAGTVLWCPDCEAERRG